MSKRRRPNFLAPLSFGLQDVDVRLREVPDDFLLAWLAEQGVQVANRREAIAQINYLLGGMVEPILEAWREAEGRSAAAVEPEVAPQVEPEVERTVEQKEGSPASEGEVARKVGRRVEPGIGPAVAHAVDPAAGPTVERKVEHTVVQPVGPRVESQVGREVDRTVDRSVKPVKEAGAAALPDVPPGAHSAVRSGAEAAVARTVEPEVSDTVEQRGVREVEHTVEQTTEPRVEPAHTSTVDPGVEPQVEPSVERVVGRAAEVPVAGRVERQVKRAVEPGSGRGREDPGEGLDQRQKEPGESIAVSLVDGSVLEVPLPTGGLARSTEVPVADPEFQNWFGGRVEVWRAYKRRRKDRTARAVAVYLDESDADLVESLGRVLALADFKVVGLALEVLAWYLSRGRALPAMPRRGRTLRIGSGLLSIPAPVVKVRKTYHVPRTLAVFWRTVAQAVETSASEVAAIAVEALARLCLPDVIGARSS